jgi:hypothetical protein
VYTTHDVGLSVWAHTNTRASNRSQPWPADLTPTPTLFAGALHGALHANTEGCVTDCFQGYDVTDASSTARTNWTSPPLDECCVARQIKGPSVDGGWATVLHLSRMPMESAVDMTNPMCEDQLHAPAPLNRFLSHGIDTNGGISQANVFRMAVGDSVDSTACGGPCPPTRPFCSAADGECVVPVCDSLIAWCNDDSVTGLRTRNLCPHTCGCDHPRSALALTTPVSGCPTTCTTTASFDAARSTLPCTDTPLTGNFSSYLDHVHLASRGWPSNAADNVDLVMPGFRKGGCAFIEQLGAWSRSQYFGQFCFGTLYPIKPFAYLSLGSQSARTLHGMRALSHCAWREHCGAGTFARPRADAPYT